VTHAHDEQRRYPQNSSVRYALRERVSLASSRGDCSGDLLSDEDLQTQRATAPPKRWRNWALVVAPFKSKCLVCGAVREPEVGSIYRGCCRTFPSKDIAESFAVNHPTSTSFYLGAFEQQNEN
jgi:hypothetical protein